MGYMVEITENAIDELAENAENILRYAGKVMQCVEGLTSERSGGRMGHRMPEGDNWRMMPERDGERGEYPYYPERRGSGGYRR